MVEYHILVSVYMNNGQNIKYPVKSSDRDNAITKFTYLQGLLKDKRKSGELRDWTTENINVPGVVTGIDGVYGVAYVRIL
jgi:hypothetical protein